MKEETGINHFSSCQLLANDEWEVGEGMIHHRFFYELSAGISLDAWSHQPTGGGAEEGQTFSFFWLSLHQQEVLVPGQADYVHLL